MNISISKDGQGNWLYSYKGIITVISEVQLPVANGKPQVGRFNPHKVTIAYDHAGQKPEGIFGATVKAAKGLMSAFIVADFEVEDYSVESYIKAAAADRLFINLDRF